MSEVDRSSSRLPGWIWGVTFSLTHDSVTSAHAKSSCSFLLLGFSGTPSNLLPVDMGDCGFEPGCQASIVNVMTSPACMSYTQLKPGWDMFRLISIDFL